jgi:hypothetical protein
MQKQNRQTTARQNWNSDSQPRRTLKVLLGFIGIAVLLNLALASAALNYLALRVVDGRQGIATRANWYLHSGQLQADARSLAAALDYIMATDQDVPATTTNLAVLPVVEDAASDTPKS